MKRAYIIHAWGEAGGSLPWYNWLTEKLKEKGFEVEAFDMPDSKNPTIESWVGFLEKQIPVEEINEETYFIGHSIGCQTVIRFLEKLHKHKRVAGCVFVSGWFELTKEAYEDEGDRKLMHPWTTSKVNFERVADHCDNFLAIFSDDDPYVHYDEIDKFKNNLGAKTIMKKGEKHFEETEEVPEILEFVK